MRNSSEFDSPAWMVVLRTNNPAEAHVIAGRLQSEGIGAWVHQEPYGSALGITVGMLGELRVVVKPADYERALSILDSEVEALPEDVDQVIFGPGVGDDDDEYLDASDESYLEEFEDEEEGEYLDESDDDESYLDEFEDEDE